MDYVARTITASRTGSRLDDSPRTGPYSLSRASTDVIGLVFSRVGRPATSWQLEGRAPVFARFVGEVQRRSPFVALKGGSHSVDSGRVAPPLRAKRNRVDVRN